MSKKLVLLIVSVFSTLSLSVQAWRNDEITMLVIPRETIPLQIGQDISRRYPVLLVSYQLVRGNLRIDAWNGDDWVYVPVEDYTNGTFFANRPKDAILVENEKIQTPDLLTPNSLWCGSAYRLNSTDPRVMLHLLGLKFDFPFRHWDQMAKRYGYALEEINPTLENVYWWDLQGDVLLDKRARRDFSVDLNHWQPLATLPAPVIESVIATEEPVPAAPAPSATAVDITAKAAKEPVKTAPAAQPVLKTEPAAPKPVVVPETAAPEIPAPAPMIEAAPSVEQPVEKAVTAVEETVASAPEIPATAPAETPAVTKDPFAGEEVPAAEIVIPAESKNTWWK